MTLDPEGLYQLLKQQGQLVARGADILYHNEIDGVVFRTLTENDFRSIGLSFGVSKSLSIFRERFDWRPFDHGQGHIGMVRVPSFGAKRFRAWENPICRTQKGTSYPNPSNSYDSYYASSVYAHQHPAASHKRRVERPEMRHRFITRSRTANGRELYPSYNNRNFLEFNTDRHARKRYSNESRGVTGSSTCQNQRISLDYSNPNNNFYPPRYMFPPSGSSHSAENEVQSPLENAVTTSNDDCISGENERSRNGWWLHSNVTPERPVVGVLPMLTPGGKIDYQQGESTGAETSETTDEVLLIPRSRAAHNLSSSSDIQNEEIELVDQLHSPSETFHVNQKRVVKIDEEHGAFADTTTMKPATVCEEIQKWTKRPILNKMRIVRSKGSLKYEQYPEILRDINESSDDKYKVEIRVPKLVGENIYTSSANSEWDDFQRIGREETSFVFMRRKGFKNDNIFYIVISASKMNNLKRTAQQVLKCLNRLDKNSSR